MDDDVAEFDLEEYEGYDLQLVHSNLDELSDSLQSMALFMHQFVEN